MQNTYTAVVKTPGHIEINMLAKKTVNIRVFPGMK